ncbi:MAG: nucleotidyl transferase AbiEii/AbiGii toxin family protein [Thermoanaerobaculia bacterium]
MTAREVRDLAASVHARLLRLAHERGEELQRVLVKFALERFLFRLGASRIAGQYVLKGALLFQVWEAGLPRMTRDLDLLGLGDNSEAAIRAAFREILEAQAPGDGLRFDPESVSVAPIAQQTTYVGMRVKCRAFLGKAIIPLQIDVGFGDRVFPEPETITYPTLLEFPAPRVLAYAKETVVAEKTQAMIELGLLNSRLKDYFDLCYLARTQSFDGRRLQEAITATLQRRKTPSPLDQPEGLSARFAAEAGKQAQWHAFQQRAGLAEEDLENVVEQVSSFVSPVLEAMALDEEFAKQWPPAGPWHPSPPAD